MPDTRCPRRCFLTLLLAWVLILAGCARAPLYQQESFVFGTRVEILIAGLDESRARPAAAAVLSEFDRLHRTYHAWQPSELSQLNADLAQGKARVVSAEMAAFLAEAKHLSALGESLFDPGIGELIRLWGFHAEDYKAKLPDPESLNAWLAKRPGIADLHLDGTKASSANRRLAIDLGGYLKGVALDRAATILLDLGVRNALINIGGNVMALGNKNGEPWKVGIQHPRRPGPIATLVLNDGEAIGTSGDYQRFFELSGKRYCHLLDPRTAWPVTHTQSLTLLITPRQKAGTLSDALTKPLFIAGPDWPRLARKLSVDHVLRVDAEGHLQVSKAMRDRLEFVDKPGQTMEIIP